MNTQKTPSLPLEFRAPTAELSQLHSLKTAALDLLMPMHLIVSSSGHIVQAGPTLKKILGAEYLISSRFVEVFEINRPRGAVTMAHLMAAEGGKLRLRLRDEPRTQMQGLIVPFSQSGDVLVNLSFGFAVVEAVNHWHLNCGDFAPTDLTLEMLYLIEAKSAAQSEQKKLNQKLHGAKLRAEEMALTDGLTGLSNRRALDINLKRLIRDKGMFAMMHIDLDYFKDVNDRLGHAAGDAVLLEVARILRSETRSSDVVARVGGDEFTILLHRLVDPAKLEDVAQRVIRRLEVPISYGNETCEISGSVGITVSEAYDPPEAEVMMRDADTALYASKFKGRAQATLYEKGLETFVEEQVQNAKSAR